MAHIIGNPKFLLFIEPEAKFKSELPVEDEMTKMVEELFNESNSGTSTYSRSNDSVKFRFGGCYRGVHQTSCGMASDDRDYEFPNGMITNSLCVYYVSYYRDYIINHCPSEYEKLKSLMK